MDTTQNTFTATLSDGTSRAFTLSRVSSLRARALVRRCQALMGKRQEYKIYEIVNAVIEREDLTQEAMQTAYLGEHAGINWYADVDAADVTVALIHFFYAMLPKSVASSDGSQTSSPSTDEKSQQQNQDESGETSPTR